MPPPGGGHLTHVCVDLTPFRTKKGLKCQRCFGQHPFGLHNILLRLRIAEYSQLSPFGHLAITDPLIIGGEVPENKKLLKTPAITDSLLRTPNLGRDGVRYNKSWLYRVSHI